MHPLIAVALAAAAVLVAPGPAHASVGPTFEPDLGGAGIAAVGAFEHLDTASVLTYDAV